jgi:hypothetical protein
MHATYNFDPTTIADLDFDALYTKRRRDALFAFTLPQSDGSVILGRDHLGAIPLYYRVQNGQVRASTHLRELVDGTETPNPEGVSLFIALGTAKLESPFVEIHTVPHGTVLQVYPHGKVRTLYQYRFTPTRTPRRFSDSCDALDTLLAHATTDSLHGSTHVGLYLSGGIDSGLTGSYLKRAGATVTGYTTTPWGADSAEGRLAKENAVSVGTTSHNLVAFNTSEYAAYAAHATRSFANPCGATAALAIACIGSNTHVGDESHIFFAQNADTATASVADQSLLFGAHLVPHLIRRHLHASLHSKSLIDNYVALRTAGVMSHYAPLSAYTAQYSRLEQVTLAGMLFGHTPVDGDIVIQPTLNQGQKLSNLFYHVDVIEFLMGMPLQHRVARTTEGRFGIGLKKRVLRELGTRTLTPAVLARKKGLSVPTTSDPAARAFFDTLPTHAGGRTLKLPHHRFAAYMLRSWAASLPQPPESLIKDIL